MSVGRLAAGDDAKGCHHLLQWMRLQVSRSTYLLFAERLVFDSQLYTPEEGAGNTERRLKVAFIVYGRQTADTEVALQNVVHTG